MVDAIAAKHILGRKPIVNAWGVVCYKDCKYHYKEQESCYERSSFMNKIKIGLVFRDIDTAKDFVCANAPRGGV